MSRNKENLEKVNKLLKQNTIFRQRFKEELQKSNIETAKNLFDKMCLNSEKVGLLMKENVKKWINNKH